MGASTLAWLAPPSTLAAGISSLAITIYYTVMVVPRASRAVYDPAASSSRGVVSSFTLITIAMLLAYGGPS